MIWTHAKTNAGYGVLVMFKTNWFAHRIAYEMWVDEIPDGYDIHHTCENRACIEPSHLQALTRKEHLALGINRHKTHCKRGHEFTPENTIPVKRKGAVVGRSCRACMNERNRLWMKANYPAVKAQREAKKRAAAEAATLP